ncbi:RNA polymerase sigma-32 factor [Novosphingobium resinovorum]|uniref:RNA polymerase sigma factor RpoH n=1 Tax=Novosphingobium resinovorum TaxID=158500 RepID=A0A031IYX9_9SPHN|nr:RNA polymerase sigma factor RpoH [Novosphingobium resinovorum]EZP66181.1 RNA polymerase sigma-32 factor [Novosphingobium resinovorum]
MTDIALKNAVIPAPAGEDGLNRYLAEIRKFPILSPEDEYMLAKRFKEHGDPEAAAKLVTSHLRLVAKAAMRYRGYGLPVADLISEGNVGLIQGVRRFDPDRGFRLATYALWWIKASIQEFILRSWSMVKLGTTAAQKRLFFNLRRIKNSLQAYDDTDLKPDQVRQIADTLGVSETEVTSMNRRMMQGGDASLNVPLGETGEDQWQDLLTDDSPLQDEALAGAQEHQRRQNMLFEALGTLSDRERDILVQRRLIDEPKTLEDLSLVYKVSRERVRQIEVRAFEKLSRAMHRIDDEQRIAKLGGRRENQAREGH